MRFDPSAKAFHLECSFIAGAAKASQLPKESLPEVAFCGRSNVGKSSLINALTFHNKLARVSTHPGRTRQVNFFNIGGRFILVDLPGYGYAQASKKEVHAWGELITAYVQSRASLRNVFMLIDCRHPLKQSDQVAINYFQGMDIPFQIVLTKIDKDHIHQDLLSSLTSLSSKLSYCHPHILHTSAKEKIGLDELRFSVTQSTGVLGS